MSIWKNFFLSTRKTSLVILNDLLLLEWEHHPTAQYNTAGLHWVCAWDLLQNKYQHKMLFRSNCYELMTKWINYFLWINRPKWVHVMITTTNKFSFLTQLTQVSSRTKKSKTYLLNLLAMPKHLWKHHLLTSSSLRVDNTFPWNIK